MSQQYPYLPNGQAIPQAQNLYPQTGGGLPTGYGVQPGMVPGQDGLPAGLQGMDPAMLAQMQQAMAANPDDGDGFSILPSPKDAAIGAAGGIGIAVALNKLEERHLVDKVAKGIDGIPGINWINQRIDGKLANIGTAQSGFWAQKGWLRDSLQESFHPQTFTEVNRISALPLDKLRAEAIRKAEAITDEALRGPAVTQAKTMSEKALRSQAVQDAVQLSLNQMQQRQLGATLGNFRGYFPAKNPKYSAAYKQMLQEMRGTGQKTLNLINENGLSAKNATFEKVIASADEQLKFLEAKKIKGPHDKHLLKVLHNLKERVSGLNNNYLPVYKEQVALSARLQAKKIGPVGRMFANGVNYLKRIFNGETMRMGGQKAADAAAHVPSAAADLSVLGKFKNYLSKIWSKVNPYTLPAMAGALILGQSLQKARKAKEGEKTQTFFHDFIGVGIANFIGWEFGRKLLNSMQFSSKLLGKSALRTLPKVFGNVIPLIGGITLGGFVTEILAMFVIGSVFQKAGELISHKIFGKPSDESIEGKAKKQQQNPPQPTQQQIMQRAHDPGRRENIQKMLPATKFPKRPKTELTPDIIRRSMAAENQNRIDKAFLNSPWNPEDQLNPYKTQY